MARIDIKQGKGRLSGAEVSAVELVQRGHKSVAADSNVRGRARLKKIGKAHEKNMKGKAPTSQDIKDVLEDPGDKYPWVGKATEDGMVEITAEDEEVHLIVFGEYGTPTVLQYPPPPSFDPQTNPAPPGYTYVPDEEFEVQCAEIVLQPGQSFSCPLTAFYEKTIVIVKG